MTLQDKLDSFRQKFETEKVSAEVRAVMDRATNDLIASRQAERAVRAGDLAPSFSLPDSDGHIVESGTLLSNGPLVVTFYRGVWCPYCNMDLQAIEAVADDMSALGASLVAISPQTPANSRKIRQAQSLTFPILSDHEGKTAQAFGLRFALPDDLIAIYKGFGVDLPLINGEPSWTLPMPARYVIGRDGTIVYAEVNPDYRRRPEPSELLPVLDRLRRNERSA